MTKADLQDLYRLLTQLKMERIDKYAEDDVDVLIMEPDELYELDDGDMLISCADGVLGVIEDMLKEMK